MPLTILLHSSKTMRSPQPAVAPSRPMLLEQAEQLAAYLQSLSASDIQLSMHVSAPLAEKTHDTLAAWNSNPADQSLAIDSFVGDIYSGLQAGDLDTDDRAYAQEHLRILSGLYGILRPLDGVRPYRLEMGYRLPDPAFASLYHFWDTAIAGMLPAEGVIVNVSAVEYTKTITPYVDASRIIAPRFYTRHPKTGKPTQVVVHTKIARGAFARWLITSRTTDPRDFKAFSALDYRYDAALSSQAEPAFVCETFGGIGLSVRLDG